MSNAEMQAFAVSHLGRPCAMWCNARPTAGPLAPHSRTQHSQLRLSEAGVREQTHICDVLQDGLPVEIDLALVELDVDAAKPVLHV